MTRTMKLQELELRQSSTAVPMTTFVPTGNKAPRAEEVNMAGFAVQLSVATGSRKLTLAPPEYLGVSAALNGGGQVISGGVVSWTMTVCRQLLMQPLLSVTVKLKMKLVLQPLALWTLTVWLVAEPEIRPPPASDQE